MQSRVKTLKVGVVNYLNARPMMIGFEDKTILHDFEFVYDVPSRLARKLIEKKLDIALVPVIEYFRNDKIWNLLQAPAICSFGKVKSVKLYLNKPLENIQTIALDPSSRTSSALIQILFWKYTKLSPKFCKMKTDLEAMMHYADAGLLIGDKTFLIDESQFVEVIDLGEWWTNKTNLPFVFAVWVARNEINSQNFMEKVAESFRYGFGQIRNLADQENGLTASFVEQYLTKNIQYKLSKSALRGMEKFRKEWYDYSMFIDKKEKIK